MLLKAMTHPLILYDAPSGSGRLILGQTLPSLLDEACDRHPNDQALNQWQNRHWHSVSNIAFRNSAEEFALGLLSLGLNRGDRVALVMHNGIPFCIADLGCLLAGLVDVPIDLTQTIENILFILQQTEAQVLVISNQDLLNQLVPYLWDAPDLRWVIVAEGLETQREEKERPRGTAPETQGERQEHAGRGDQTLKMPQLLCAESVGGVCPATIVPTFLQLQSFEEVLSQGKCLWTQDRVRQLRQAIDPKDLATILYIASDKKQPKGVMLSHESISADILAAFSSFPNLEVGAKEVALLFLPLTHVFARAFLYGHLAYGHSIYFSDPNHVIKHLKLVRPSIMIAVPRLLEKLYERILEQEHRLSSFDQQVFRWSLQIAQRYEVGKPLSHVYRVQLRLADRLVLNKWRILFGDRLKALIVGGAALKAELTNVFSAAGIPVFQGYGLTETSAVLCYNRGSHHQAGTVGIPIPGVEIALADDREILVKAPFVMQGYYRDPQATQQVLSPDGWLHTGDLGEITPRGFLKITGVKKAQFKLTTGKYVSPLALEQEVAQSPLVNHAIAIGANRKFCGMLIFPNWEALVAKVPQFAFELENPCILALYQSLIDQANCHLPYWSTVRKFKLIASSLTIENGLLQPDGSLDRQRVLEFFAPEIESLYAKDTEKQSASLPDSPRHSPTPSSPLPPTCPVLPAPTCPASAQSLIHN